MALFNRVLKEFSSPNLKLMFAYGSGVFKQFENNPSTSSIIDFVFVVDDAFKFHSENIEKNPSHYSFLKHLGPFYLTKIQNDIPAAVYYNTLVKYDDSLIKYGVISTDAFIKDLLDWEYFYTSGRMNKPVKFLKKDMADVRITNAVKVNLYNALHTALLLLPERFSLEDFFITVTGLSYTGDFRMVLGENKNKIRNIVTPNFEHFLELYRGLIIKEAPYLYLNDTTNMLQQDKSSNAIYHHLYFLPKNLMNTIIHSAFKLRQYNDMEEMIFKLATYTHISNIVAKSISNIVGHSSKIQTVKGLFTAGVLKSFQYSSRKLKKMIFKS